MIADTGRKIFQSENNFIATDNSATEVMYLI